MRVLARSATLASTQTAVDFTRFSMSLVGFCRVLMHYRKFFQCSLGCGCAGGVGRGPGGLARNSTASTFEPLLGVSQYPLRVTVTMASVPMIPVAPFCPNIGVGTLRRSS